VKEQRQHRDDDDPAAQASQGAKHPGEERAEGDKERKEF